MEERRRDGGPDHAERADALRQKVIDAIAETMDLYGAAPSVGQLYGIMFFEDRPMTLEEMKTTMGMSKSSMSYGIRTLLESKMVVKLEQKDRRKNLYRAEDNFYTAFRNFFTIKLQREIHVMMSAVNEVMPELKELVLAIDTPEPVRRQALGDLHKLFHAADYYEWLQQFVRDLRDGRLFGGREDRREAGPTG